nr:putative ribonuclease H-like domain-containing protein [Tanacetum cinerariifolium]
GIVIRNKARLVAQGYTQEEGINYEEVFDPVARIEAIRLFLAYASFMGFLVYQMHVKSAFFYGTIKEEVYVCQPPGFEDPDHLNKVYKVVKVLYGLHQAPRAWYETLATYLLENGFHRGTIDQTLFIKHKGDILLVQIYVDDIIFGLQVKQKKDGIFISKDKYVIEILRKFRLTEGKSASTLIDSEKPLLKDADGEDVDVHIYRSMIGSLMYLTSSRPDIMFAVCACARFQVSPKASHLNAVKRIFRYLKGKPHLGLWYLKDLPFDLVAYSDSNYVGASLDRKSTTRGCQFLRCRLISWQCKKQTVIATSSIEAEYVAATSGYAQVLWIQNQLLDYGLQTLVDKKKVRISEAIIREVLHLDDAEGMDCLLNEEIFEEGDTTVTTEDVNDEVIPFSAPPTSPPHDIPSTSQVHSPLPQQPGLTPSQPQGAEFPMHLLQQVLDTCATLTQHVEHLENDKAAQKLEITKLQTRVKKIESFDDLEDVSNQGRIIADMDKDERIELIDDLIDEVQGRQSKISKV